MPNRVFFTMIVLLAASTANAQKQARTSLLLLGPEASSSGHGARVGAGFVVPPLIKVFTTFAEFHFARVENDIMLFQPTLVGMIQPAGASNSELFASPPPKNETRFFVPAETANDLEVRRERDRLLLFRGPQPQGAAVALGLAMFGAMTVLSAHAPRAFRIVFDGPVHLGPAIFDGGGMGAGIAGRGL